MAVVSAEAIASNFSNTGMASSYFLVPLQLIRDPAEWPGFASNCDLYNPDRPACIAARFLLPLL